MENYAGMSELVEIIFGKKPTIHEEKVAHSSIPSSCLTEDFRNKIDEILVFKMFIIQKTYREIFGRHIQKVLSSHEEYLKYLMSFCLRECQISPNIFDSFIGVSMCVGYITKETDLRTEVDYIALRPDILMVFYQKVLKKPFLKHKGFYKFLDYIHSHRYLEWNRKMAASSLPSCRNQTLNVDPSLIQDIDKESSWYCEFEELLHDGTFSKKVNARSLALEVLSNTSIKLPTLPSKRDLVIRLVASAKRQIERDAERHRIKENARHEDIIQAVIRHNQSENSDSENAKNQIPKEADRILEHMKNTIKSLTEVLDEYDKE